MNSGSSSTPQNVVTTQNRDPWVGAQPALGTVLQGATDLYVRGGGYHPYTGQTQASITPGLQSALDTEYQMLSQGDLGTVSNARNLANQLQLNQGITSGIGNTITGNAGLQQAVDKLYQMSGDPTSWNQYNSIYNEANGQQNPYLQGILDTQGRKIADQVNSNMSGAGRYGSGAHTNVLSRNLAEAQLPLLAQDYQNRQQTRLAATQGQQNALAQQMAATQAQAGLQGNIADLYGQGLNRAGQWAQLAPTLDQARFSDIDRLKQLGNFYQGRAQNDLQSQINLYNAQQAWDTENLARFNAIASGVGGLGGTQVTSTPNLNAPVGGLQSAFGGALAGAGLGGSIFGPTGAALGAGAGGLLGLLR